MHEHLKTMTGRPMSRGDCDQSESQGPQRLTDERRRELLAGAIEIAGEIDRRAPSGTERRILRHMVDMLLDC